MAVLQGEASGWIWDNGLYSCICLGWWVPREYYCFRQATTSLLSIRTLESQLRGPLILRVLASYVTLPPQCPLCQPCPISQVRKLSPLCWCLRRLCAFLKLKGRRAIWMVHDAQETLKSFWWNKLLYQLGNLPGAKLKQKSNFCPLPGCQSFMNGTANMIVDLRDRKIGKLDMGD